LFARRHLLLSLSEPERDQVVLDIVGLLKHVRSVSAPPFTANAGTEMLQHLWLQSSDACKVRIYYEFISHISDTSVTTNAPFVSLIASLGHLPHEVFVALLQTFLPHSIKTCMSILQSPASIMANHVELYLHLYCIQHILQLACTNATTTTATMQALRSNQCTKLTIDALHSTAVHQYYYLVCDLRWVGWSMVC
jgi:hypothetical protein